MLCVLFVVLAKLMYLIAVAGNIIEQEGIFEGLKTGVRTLKALGMLCCWKLEWSTSARWWTKKQLNSEQHSGLCLCFPFSRR